MEALSGVIYRPESIRTIDQYHREIASKNCVLSAKDDNLATTKTYVLHAAQRQGLVPDTEVAALADGAHNCWSVIFSLEPHCKRLTCILDWFHIGQKFQTVRSALTETFQENLELIKWTLWNGKLDAALTKLKLLMTNVTDLTKRSKLKGLYDYLLYDYLKRNQAYLVNYQEREQMNKTYTSQVAKSHIESIINARHKKSGKMQWTREGAQKVLQIRGLSASQWGDR